MTRKINYWGKWAIVTNFHSEPMKEKNWSRYLFIYRFVFTLNVKFTAPKYFHKIVQNLHACFQIFSSPLFHKS